MVVSEFSHKPLVWQVLLAWAVWIGWAQTAAAFVYEVAKALGRLGLDTVLLVWNSVVWRPSIMVFPMVFGASAASDALWLQAAWMHCLCMWLMGGGWAGLVGCAGLFHERASGGGGVHALLFASAWFGVSWAWSSWWGVVFLVVAVVAYFLLALILQVRSSGEHRDGISFPGRVKNLFCEHSDKPLHLSSLDSTHWVAVVTGQTTCIVCPGACVCSFPFCNRVCCGGRQVVVDRK
jgi:hypothetical protein